MSELPVFKISLINLIRKINLLYKRENNTHTGNRYIYVCLSQTGLKVNQSWSLIHRDHKYHSYTANPQIKSSHCLKSKTPCECLLVEGRVPFNRFRLTSSESFMSHTSRGEDIH